MTPWLLELLHSASHTGRITIPRTDERHSGAFTLWCMGYFREAGMGIDVAGDVVVTWEITGRGMLHAAMPVQAYA